MDLFGIKKLNRKVEYLESRLKINKDLATKIKSYLPFEGFDKLPVSMESMFMLDWVLEDMMRLIIKQQKEIEELKKV